MHIKRIGAIIVALLIFIPCFALADNKTKALVQFEEGDLIIEDVDEQGKQDMDEIDFGLRTLPAKSETYTADKTKEYTLRVVDARSATKEWKMTVSMGKFSALSPAPASSFAATINLAAPKSKPASTNLTVNTAAIVSDVTPGVTVLAATDNLGRGTYDVVWKGDQISLVIDNFRDVNVANYEAALTWRLERGPF